jgi:hypothetical protein
LAGARNSYVSIGKHIIVLNTMLCAAALARDSVELQLKECDARKHKATVFPSRCMPLHATWTVQKEIGLTQIFVWYNLILVHRFVFEIVGRLGSATDLTW